jgi:hypothetical protein
MTSCVHKMWERIWSNKHEKSYNSRKNQAILLKVALNTINLNQKSDECILRIVLLSNDMILIKKKMYIIL